VKRGWETRYAHIERGDQLPHTNPLKSHFLQRFIYSFRFVSFQCGICPPQTTPGLPRDAAAQLPECTDHRQESFLQPTKSFSIKLIGRETVYSVQTRGDFVEMAE
jgi:hypothetical protein